MTREERRKRYWEAKAFIDFFVHSAGEKNPMYGDLYSIAKAYTILYEETYGTPNKE